LATKKLFLENYLFRGGHAAKVRELLKEVDKETSAKLFNSAIELFMISAVIGCINNKRSIPEISNDTFNIFAEQFSNHGATLRYLLKLVLLVSDSKDLNNIDRINRAFREIENEDNVNLFEEYVLGGLEEIHSHFFEGNKRLFYDDFYSALKIFVSDYNKLENDNLDEFDDDELLEDILRN